MPSLKKKLARERDALITRGGSIGFYAKRLHTRLRDPAAVLAAFLGGVLIGRGAALLQTLPQLTARSAQLTDALGKANAVIKLIDSLLSVGLSSSGSEPDDSDNLLSSARREHPGRRPPRN